jgi:hypothetical protein
MAGIIVADTIQSGGDLIRLNSASQTVATINARGIYANTGNLLIAANGTIGVASITNTAITGTMTQAQIGNGIAGTGPAFRAFGTTNQTVSHNVVTKVNFNSETFDTASCFDTSLFRFTPNVAGYYFVFYQLCYGGTATRTYSFTPVLYKNTSVINQKENSHLMGPSMDRFIGNITDIIYMNGTTDYLEAHTYHFDFTSATTATIFLASSTAFSSFGAHLIRAA